MSLTDGHRPIPVACPLNKPRSGVVAKGHMEATTRCRVLTGKATIMALNCLLISRAKESAPRSGNSSTVVETIIVSGLLGSKLSSTRGHRWSHQWRALQVGEWMSDITLVSDRFWFRSPRFGGNLRSRYLCGDNLKSHHTSARSIATEFGVDIMHRMLLAEL